MVKTKEITLSVPDCTLGELIRHLQAIECCTVTSSATTFGTEIKFHGSTQTIAQCANIGVICAWAAAHDKSVELRCGFNVIMVEIIPRY